MDQSFFNLKRNWPMLAILLVMGSLFVSVFKTGYVQFNNTDTFYVCGNSLIVLTDPGAGTTILHGRWSPYPFPHSSPYGAFISASGIHPGAKYITIPMWPYQLALVSIALWVMVRRGCEGENLKAGICPCGYNLYGNVSGICPECGAAIAVVQTVSGSGNEIETARKAEVKQI